MDVQAKINEMWDGAAHEYDSRPSHGIQDATQMAAWEAALRPLLPTPPADVLDIGTGTGIIAMLLADLGYRVRGVDLSEAMLSEARRKAEHAGLSARFEIGDAMDPRGEPASIDAVVSRHVLWTLTDPPRALKSWLRLLRPGGRLVIIDGLWGAKPDPRMTDMAASLPLLGPSVSLDDIRGLVAAAGFVDVVVSDLVDVDRVERELGADPASEPHYVITAANPR